MPRRRLRLGAHYATTTLYRQIGPLRVWEFMHPPGCRIPEHRHERAHLVIMLAGGVAERETDGSTTVFEEGDAVLYPRGATHANTFGGVGARSLGVEFEADYLPNLMPHDLPRLGRNLALGRSAKRAGLKIAHAARAGAASRLERAVRSLVLEFARAAVPEPDWVSLIKDELRERAVLEPDIRELARRARRHPAHVMREFRRHVGVTVGEYVRALRVAQACRELRTPRARLSDVALAHGFADQSHFVRTFQRFMNMTPDEYRKMHAHSA
ncbi:MAG: AraC family transcriptional regulator [Alphaproteobacteria bacterium]|nr:AraC family transcriptional regulator [Alphaproteobacteria bacterium]